MPYFQSYRVPHQDYFHVINVLNGLQFPDNFIRDPLTQILSEAHLVTAPVYYYGLAYPLSFLLPPKWVLLAIGFALSLGCAYFAGERWRKPRDYVTALLLLFCLLQVYLTPLEGNRRSFTAFFLLGVLWLGPTPNYRWVLVFTALAGGIYPPAGLLVLVYYGLMELRALYPADDLRAIKNCAYRLITAAGVFLLVTGPILIGLHLTGDSSSYQYFNLSIPYEFDSAGGVVRSLFFADDVVYRGAMFRNASHYNLFTGMLVLVGLQYLLLKKSLRIKTRYLLLGLGSLMLWALAHLIHPLLYQPVKYTRMALLLVPTIVFLRNLPATTLRLTEEFSGVPLVRWLVYFMGVWLGFIFFLLSSNLLDYHHLYRFSGLVPFVWKILFGGLFSLTVLVALSDLGIEQLPRTVVSGFILLSVLFLPFTFGPTSIEPEDAPRNTIRYEYTRYGDLYRSLRATPPTTILAGPPVIMNVLQAFGRRGTFTDKSKHVLKQGCNRTKKFWTMYYSGDQSRVKKFLQRHGIERLLVDRRLFRTDRILADEQCFGSPRIAEDPVLDRAFPGALWSHRNRLFLISPAAL